MSQIEVILCKRIANLGTVGDKVFVKAGFARNYLIPQELAVRVNDENLKEFEAKRAQLESQERDLLKEAQQRAEKVKDLRLCKEVKTSVDGKLYGSVAPRDVVSLIIEAGIEINKQQVHLVAGNIHQVGSYEVLLQFHSDVMVKIMLDITSSNPEYDPSVKEKTASESVENEESGDVVEEAANTETAKMPEEVAAEAAGKDSQSEHQAD